ncbi:MAG TPA: hypothetical protein VGD45_14085 [Steroidobacter sp.]|uniref:hypothetical protein n=1 Tax=Steroidobacter sp. TaxID=1978227 RepID=UPI002EDB4085
MLFSDPLLIRCPSCGKEGSYAPRDLVALRSLCRHCSLSLDAVGQEMREGLSSWSGYLAKIDMAIEFERLFGIQPTDADLDTIKTPLDLVKFFRGRVSVGDSDVEGEAFAWLTRVRPATASRDELQLDFTELFSVTEHP